VDNCGDNVLHSTYAISGLFKAVTHQRQPNMHQENGNANGSKKPSLHKTLPITLLFGPTPMEKTKTNKKFSILYGPWDPLLFIAVTRVLGVCIQIIIPTSPLNETLFIIGYRVKLSLI